jgi:hypothetical protein
LLTDEGPDVNVSLSDREPPRLANISFDYYFRPASEALVSVEVDDAGGSGVRAVWLTCSLDGKAWARRPMYRVGESRYEGTITGLGSAGSVRYRVISTDWLNNTATGPVETRDMETPAPEASTGMLEVAMLMGVVGVACLLVSRSRKH